MVIIVIIVINILDILEKPHVSIKSQRLDTLIIVVVLVSIDVLDGFLKTSGLYQVPKLCCIVLPLHCAVRE